MKITYDKKQDAVYFKFGEGNYEVTKKMSESVLGDYDTEGSVVGIEILDASTNISQFDPERMTIAFQ